MRALIRKGHRAELAALAIFSAIAIVGFAFDGWPRALLAGFAASSLLYSGAIAVLLQACDESELPALAARHDRRAPHILAAGLFLDFASLALVVALVATRTMDGFATALAGASILGAWALLNTLFAIHYAHVYFTSAAPPLAFPGRQPRVFSDFLYFSFVIGMTFQVSDISILDAGLRRLALAHSILAFLFNVFVVALAVNALGSVV